MRLLQLLGTVVQVQANFEVFRATISVFSTITSISEPIIIIGSPYGNHSIPGGVVTATVRAGRRTRIETRY
jgi:S1-C subfamily serine protease